MNRTVLDRLTGPRGPFEMRKLESGILRFVRPPHTLSDIYRRAERADRKIFLVTGARSYDYRDVFRRARVLSHEVQKRSLIGKRVALVVDDGADWIAWFLAITGAGAICVMPPSGATLNVTAHCLTVANCAAIVGSDEFDLPRLDTRSARSAKAGDGEGLGWPELDPAGEALVAFTSGSSGAPKGVVHTHRSLLSGLRNMLLGGAVASQMTRSGLGDTRPAKPPQPATLLLAPMGYVAGFSALLLTLMSGGKIVLAAGSTDPQELTEVILRHSVQSITGGSAAMIRRLVDHCSASTRLASLRRVQLHGEGLQASLLKRIAQVLPDLQVMTGYGLTETAGSVAIAPAQRVAATPGGCGLVLPSVEMRIVDSIGVGAPFGQPGHIELRGDMLMSGYLTAGPMPRSFTPDGWFATGDIGIIDPEGWLRVLERSANDGSPHDRAVELATEEALRTLEEIQDVVCISGTNGIVAFIEPKPGCSLEHDTLQWRKDTVGATGSQIALRFLDRIPRLASGKVDRMTLTAAGADDLADDRPWHQTDARA